MKFNKILLIATLIFLFNTLIVSAVSSSFTDQGTNVEYNGNLVSSANLTITIWNHPTDNSSTALMYNNTFVNAITDGIWNVKVNTTNLEFGKQYYKDYSIDVTDIDFDGEERLSFHSPLGLINNQSFVNGTSVSGWTTNTSQTTTDQNVGIGTNSPSHKLEVNGSANFSNINSEIWINGSKICTVANGLCIGTIYAAGLGLNLTGTTFSINETYLQRYNDTSTQIADNTTITTFLATLITNDSNIAAREIANNITQEARIATLFTANTTLWDRQNADNTTITTILTTKGNVSSEATIGYLPFMSTTTSLNNSAIFQNGFNIAIGTLISTQKLDVNGSANFSGQDAQVWINGSLVCTSANGVCTSGSGNVSSVGSQGYIPQFQNGVLLNNSIIYQNGSTLTIIGNISMPNSFFIGNGAEATGTDMMAIGTQAGQLSDGNYNLYAGYQAGYQAIGNLSIYTGYQAGYQANGSRNAYTGFSTGTRANGSYNTYTGATTGGSTSGDLNIYTGYQTGSAAKGDQNIYTGYQTGQQANGSYNIYTGGQAGYQSNGIYNIYTGAQAGYKSNTNYSIYIGYQAGYMANTSNSIYIGYQAGYIANTSNTIIIQQANINSVPLIKGNFETGMVAINASNPTQTLHVEGSANITGNAWIGGSQVCTTTNGLCPANNITGMTEMFLASSDTSGTQSIVNGTIINITGGNGITVTRLSSVLQINTTYQSNASGWANASTTITTDFGVNVTSGNLTVISGNIGAGTMSPLRSLHVNNVMRLEPISSAPSLPSAGDIYFDSDLNKPCYYNSTDWVTFDANTTCS